MIHLILVLSTLALVENRPKPIEPIDYSKPNKTYRPQAAQVNHRWLATSASFQYCRNPILALSIIEVESNFRNIRAKDEPSTGLMQVKPSTAQWIKCIAQSEKDLLNIDLNVRCGCRYLARIADTYPRLKDQIASYNAGAVKKCYTGTVHPSGKSCPIGGYINQDYVDKVMSIMETKYGHSKSEVSQRWVRLFYPIKQTSI